MAYIGNPAAQGNFAVIVVISGSFNGSTTQFTIQVGSTTQTIGSLAQLFIHINGVYQVPGTAFTAGSSPGTIAFTGAPEAVQLSQVRYLEILLILELQVTQQLQQLS